MARSAFRLITPDSDGYIGSTFDYIILATAIVIQLIVSILMASSSLKMRTPVIVSSDIIYTPISKLTSNGDLYPLATATWA